MGNNNLIIQLTDDQQKQIREATGKTVTELKLELSGKVPLSEAELSKVTGGAMMAYVYVTGQKSGTGNH